LGSGDTCFLTWTNVTSWSKKKWCGAQFAVFLLQLKASFFSCLGFDQMTQGIKTLTETHFIFFSVESDGRAQCCFAKSFLKVNFDTGSDMANTNLLTLCFWAFLYLHLPVSKGFGGFVNHTVSNLLQREQI
jgi:hypothetical protein